MPNFSTARSLFAVSGLAMATGLWMAGCSRTGSGDPAAATATVAPAPAAAVAHAGEAAAAEAPPAPAKGTANGMRVVHDLLANRAHAVVHQQGRLVITAGDPGFLKFVDGGWKSSWLLSEKDPARPAAFVSGVSASLVFPLDGDSGGPSLREPLNARITLRALIPKQRVSVFVNEKSITSIDVDPEWKTYDVSLPAGSLVPGENRLRLTFKGAAPVTGSARSAAALERVEIGAAAAEPAPALAVGDVDLGGSRQRAFSTTGASRLSFYVQPPKQATLALAYGAAAPGTSITVRVAADGAAATNLFEGAAGQRWTEGSWDLTRWAGQAVRIDLVSTGGGVAWGSPRLLLKSDPAKALAAKKFDRIYVWMVDTLRADKLGIYNPKSGVATPNYDAFARDATRFASAQVPGTWSLPSHASILTGVYPNVHRANSPESKLSREVPFIAELMKKAGYRTGLFSSNGYISSKWGFERGWDEDRNFIRESLANGADFLWKTAKTWLIAPAQKDKPQFVYLATVDPHVIYNPKAEFLKPYWDKPYTGPIKPRLTGIQLGHIKMGKLKINDTDKAYLEALYNAEITQSDASFGVFIADLKAAGIYDTTVVAVISDHGDEFWEHGGVGHAQSVHQELVHVPLFIRAPGALPQGKVVESDVEAMDLCPTLLELAGIKPLDSMQGASLLSLAHDELPNLPGLGLSQNGAMERGLKIGRYRFIHAGARIQLFDTQKDPREQTDLASKRPIALRHMRNVFSLVMAHESRWKKPRWGPASNLTEAFYKEAAAKRP